MHVHPDALQRGRLEGPPLPSEEEKKSLIKYSSALNRTITKDTMAALAYTSYILFYLILSYSIFF